MADTGIFATTAEVSRKAGANASSTSNAEAYINQYITEAESLINIATRYNWSDVYATLNDDTRGLLKQIAGDLAAIYVINFDMSGFTSRAEAQTMMDILLNNAQRGMSLLRDKKIKAFIDEA